MAFLISKARKSVNISSTSFSLFIFFPSFLRHPFLERRSLPPRLSHHPHPNHHTPPYADIWTGIMFLEDDLRKYFEKG
jgi:hypothetical protein